MCPYKHTITNKSRVSDEVCKYWLRGLCKMGEDCEFLHEHVTSKIPECFFYQGFGECSNPECVFRHNSMDEGIPECQAFRRGFCKYGPKCRLKHIKLDACPNFMAGLCVDGPECRLGHPSTLYITDDCIRQRMTDRRAIEECGLRAIKFIQTQCGVCGTQGHSPMQCPQNTNKVAELKRELSKKYEEPSGIGCYHCRQEDHTSNECSRKRERYMQHRHPLEGDQTQLIPGVQGTRADLNQEGDRARPKCHRCGEEGHVLRDCPLAKAEQAQGKHAPGFKPPTVCYASIHPFAYLHYISAMLAFPPTSKHTTTTTTVLPLRRGWAHCHLLPTTPIRPGWWLRRHSRCNRRREQCQLRIPRGATRGQLRLPRTHANVATFPSFSNRGGRGGLGWGIPPESTGMLKV